MTKQQQRQVELAKKHAAIGNNSSAARIISAMIRAGAGGPVADRAELMRIAIELNLHGHRDFSL